MRSTRPKLMILGTYTLLRECLAARLAELNTFEVIGHSGDPETISASFQPPPDLLLVDALGAETVLDAVSELEQRRPETKVLILGVRELDATTLRYIESGLAGAYISRETSMEELQTAIRRVLEGEIVCSPQVAYALFGKLAELSRERRREDRAEAFVLTPRQTEILQLIAEGMSNQRIADRLYLSIHTVKNHVHRILDRLEVTDRSEAVNLAYRRNWLAPKTEMAAEFH